jgi:hypothetical protein
MKSTSAPLLPNPLLAVRASGRNYFSYFNPVGLLVCVKNGTWDKINTIPDDARPE